VTGVDKFDFTLVNAGTTVSGASIASVGGTGLTRTVTVNTGTGSGTLRLDLVDNNTIRDSLLNVLGGPAGNPVGDFTGEMYTITKNPPYVVSINIANTNPTRENQVNFTVTFSESVTGVDAADFSVVNAGTTVTGAVVLTVSGTGATRTVRVDPTGTVNPLAEFGTLRLDLIDNDTIKNTALTPLGGSLGEANGSFTTGQFYTIDKKAPTVLSITRVNPDPTAAATVTFLVTFSEAVTGVDRTDFSIVNAGTTVVGATIASVGGANGTNTRTVVVNTGTGAGTLRLDLIDNDSIRDLALNRLGGTGAGNGSFTTGEFYTFVR
jgi:hypothetical protein